MKEYVVKMNMVPLNKFVSCPVLPLSLGKKEKLNCITLLNKEEELYNYLRIKEILPHTNYKEKFSHGSSCRYDPMQLIK